MVVSAKEASALHLAGLPDEVGIHHGHGRLCHHLGSRGQIWLGGQAAAWAAEHHSWPRHADGLAAAYGWTEAAAR